MFNKYDTNRSKNIDLNEFQQIIDDITKKPELIPVFKDYTEEANKQFEEKRPMMYPKELKIFFEKVQKQRLTMESILEIIDEYQDPADKENNPEKKISFKTFRDLLFSQNNSIFKSERTDVFQVFYN